VAAFEWVRITLSVLTLSVAGTNNLRGRLGGGQGPHLAVRHLSSGRVGRWRVLAQMTTRMRPPVAGLLQVTAGPRMRSFARASAVSRRSTTSLRAVAVAANSTASLTG